MDASQVNELSDAKFLETFGNVVERYDNCARFLLKLRPFKDREEIIAAASNFLSQLKLVEAEEVLQLHPDLAGKLADEKSLTNESQLEQRCAGLRDISSEDSGELRHLNKLYKEKFGFPFIICARENKFQAILQGLNERLSNKREVEIQKALEEVKKITYYRIKAIMPD